MHTVVIGGSGHIGTYLVPELVAAGNYVTVVSRGKRQPYQPHPSWSQVNQVHMDRPALERAGGFGKQMAALKPDAVIDLTCFDLPSARQLVEALRGQVQFFAHCGTLWVRGYGVRVPAVEEDARNPITEYGQKKNEIENYLLELAKKGDFPATVLHPGHISGPGWAVVGPTACHDLAVWEKLAHGKELALPNLGLETVHHVHAQDVAQAFLRALQQPQASIGQSFFVASDAALSLRGLAEAAASWFGQTAHLRFTPIGEWEKTLPPDFIDSALTHLAHSTHCSIAKAQHLLGYQPRASSLETVYQAVFWLFENGKIPL